MARNNTREKPHRESTDEYICRCFLDLVEKKPFHTIKVRELVEYAGISRSSFYTHFDSTYAVVQMLEDDFLEGFYPSDAARSVLVHGDIRESIEQSTYLHENGRVLRLLCGPNGDAYFSSRIVQVIKRICNDVWDEGGSKLTPLQRDMFSSYIAGGTLFIMRASVEGVPASEREMAGINSVVMAANDILLGKTRA